ncbi:hypothetical protein HCA61_01415 [Rhodococcus sp. HNM0563]|uniref:hypothetical protein n=1 Tax=unclassified Rhodococcus (in: high G+C Gram-positive bacteria) TaxID=192944 RepID=UPI00146AE409|nr:hypothetical protein [Rhodococcus sp. F64268]MCK0091034.1 hypothetical protein [Rhodococcus sp. F64268]NLU60925.1 hypothetical protein [Rhodococcus sp. HNM0563]
MTDDQRSHRIRIPTHLFRGRVRTSTLVLCIVWLGLWAAYLTLNQDKSQADGTGTPPTGAVIISETPFVPYVPPASSTEQAPPTTTTDVAPSSEPTTATTTPGDTPAPMTGTQPPETTTADANPFRLPQIPGLPGFDGESGTEPTGEPGQ